MPIATFPLTAAVDEAALILDVVFFVVLVSVLVHRGRPDQDAPVTSTTARPRDRTRRIDASTIWSRRSISVNVPL